MRSCRAASPLLGSGAALDEGLAKGSLRTAIQWTSWTQAEFLTIRDVFGPGALSEPLELLERTINAGLSGLILNGSVNTFAKLDTLDTF